MGVVNKNELNLAITDESISFVEKEPGIKEVESYGEVKLPKNVVKNGYIKDPEVLLQKLKTIYKSFKIKSKTVRWVIAEQNVILREIEIDKSELEKQSIDEYVTGQIGKTIHFPFKTPIFKTFIKSQTDDTLIVTLYVIDENLVQDYHDVFDRLGIKNVTYEVPELALFRLYYEKDEGRNDDEDELITLESPLFDDDDMLSDEDELMLGLMFIMVYESKLSVTIFDKEFPVMSMAEDFESPDQVFDLADQYISRISNYYRYNRNQGKQSINKVVIFNLTSVISDDMMNTEMESRLKGTNYEIFDIGTKSQYYKRLLNGGCYIPLAASLYR